MVPDKGKVSIVVPVYNSAEYLVETVQSVIHQTYRNWELLIIDDGSSEDVSSPVLSLGDARVRVIRQERAGNYFARNRGISLATGEFVAFLDADDLWVKDKLEKQMAIFGRDPEVAACFTDHYLFDEDDHNKFYKDLINTYSDDGRERGPFVQKLLEGNFIITSSVVVRRECLGSIGSFDTAYQNAMDYDLWLRIVLSCTSRYVTDRLVLKRVHVGNISRNKVNSFKAVSYIFDKLSAEKSRYPFFAPEFEPLLERRKKQLKYALGLEYLQTKDFENAAASLKEGCPPQKKLFWCLALWTARHRSETLLRLIQWYRRIRQVSSLKPAARIP